MARRAILLLLLLAAATTAGVTLKKLLDPLNPEFPLNPYAWDTWATLDRDTKMRAKGADASEWTDPPPKTEAEKKEEEELRKEREKKRREKEAKLTPEQRERLERERQKRKEQNEKQRKRWNYPGFKFDQRLQLKQNAFKQLIDPPSPSKLEGLIKQLKQLDKAFNKFEKAYAEAEEKYVQLKGQLDVIIDNQIKRKKKKKEKPPYTVMVPIKLQDDVMMGAKELSRLSSLRRSEQQFQDWLIGHIARLVANLAPEERQKPVVALAKGIADKDWRYRIRCARILGQLGDEQSITAFTKAMDKEKDPLVLAELIRIRVKRGGDGLMEFLAKRLEDPHWPVRSAVVRELATIRNKESVELLITRMEKEQGRLLDDITDALKTLTGKDFEPQPQPWRIWWDKVKAGWTPPPKPKAGETVLGKQDGKAVYFYGIRSQSKRVVFCIDISGSMQFPLDGQDGKKPARIIRAKKELNQALTALPEDAQFNIVVYSVQVRVWKKRMQPANLKNKGAARKFVEGLEPNGGTNIFDALLTSLDVAAGGKKKKKGEDPMADTIFFLTDGKPTVGRLTDANQILEEITRRNGLLGVKIHTVGVSREQDAGFLLNLAKRNHGQYVGHK